MEEKIRELLARIQSLEEENNHLKTENTLLKKSLQCDPLHDTDYQKPKVAGSVGVIESPKGVNRNSSPKEKVKLFRSLFKGREDVYPERWKSKNGKAGYSPAYDKSKGFVKDIKDRVNIPMTNQTIFDHLSGKIVAGVYALLENDYCHFLAADFDKKSWQQDCLYFLEACDFFEIEAAFERSRSGNGGHIWIFFEHAVPAHMARKLGSILLTKAMDSRPEMGLDSYDRFFPSQDTLPKGGFGNLIALPLQKEARSIGGSEFIDRNFNAYEDQWSYLDSIKRLKRDRLNDLIDKALASGDLLGMRFSIDANEDIFKPWELKPSEEFCTRPLVGELPESISVVASNLLFIDKQHLSSSLLNRLTRIAAFHNPEFYSKQAMRFSTYNIPRLVNCADEAGKYLVLPRGCLTDLEIFCQSQNIKIKLIDERNPGDPLTMKFNGELRAEQKKAVRNVLKHDDGVICAATAFGKTVVAAHLISKRKRNTLIIVHRQQLLDQWKKRLTDFLEIESECIGQIGGGKSKPTGVIDIAIIQSLNRQGTVKDLVADYGHVIVDECHHLSAFSFEKVMRKAKAKFVLGLTATPERKDGHHPIIFMQCGAIRYQMSAKEQAKLRPFRYRVFVKETLVRFDPLADKPSINDLYQQLIHDEQRNKQIIDDVKAVLRDGRKPLLLTERIEHLEILSDLLEPHVDNLIIIKGGMGKKAKLFMEQQLNDTTAEQSRLIIATGRYIGEGFDDAILDTLFLALPISWKGTLQQYAGRLHRLYEGKEEVQIYDYVDIHSTMLEAMFKRRSKGYRAMGYELTNDEQLELPKKLSHHAVWRMI